MSSGWFETVAAAQRLVKKRLPKSVYWSIAVLLPLADEGFG